MSLNEYKLRNWILKCLTKILEYFGIKNKSIEKMDGNIRQLIE